MRYKGKVIKHKNTKQICTIFILLNSMCYLSAYCSYIGCAYGFIAVGLAVRKALRQS